MAKDPSLPQTSARGNWKYKNKWVNKDGFLVDGRGNVLPGQKKSFVPAKENQFLKPTKPTGPTKPPKPTGPTKPPKPTGPTRPPKPTTPGKKAPPTPEEITNRAYELGGEAYTNITNRFENFDPNTVQSEYNPEYNAQMDRVRNSYMDQFNRRNEQAFANERTDIQQQIAERGLDPSSPAAQAMVRDMNDRQDRARQEAMGMAEQLTDQRQQQFYNQATGLARMPFEMFPAISGPLEAGMQNQFAGQQLGMQNQFTREQLGLQNQYETQQGELQHGYNTQIGEQNLQNQLRLQQDQRRGRGRGRGGPSTNPAEEAAAGEAINKYDR